MLHKTLNNNPLNNRFLIAIYFRLIDANYQLCNSNGWDLGKPEIKLFFKVLIFNFGRGVIDRL